MNSPTPLPNKSTDGTLTAMPHLAAVAAGATVGFLTTKLHLPTEYATMVSVGVATLVTTAIHWLQAKLAE